PWSEVTSRWPQATERVMAAGDHVNLDIIGAVDGYHFDVLRTAVAGPATERQQRLLAALASVQTALLQAVRPGTTVKELFAVAAAAADRHGFGNRLGPLLGHGIGLETVESPVLFPDTDAVLAPGMVLCIEPTLHIPGEAAVSVEDELVVRPHGIERLTHLPHLPA
ncbi:MAG: M24 family metallopeptidase, partial [Thermaerobacterales bacterium]